ncbi:TPA: hypothetical protein N0F65_006173 [Lagenidium giganteum]|uniref:PiggyBac transposable element-derived protein 4 C-terminal zinc-ribbon domain-containing protein n=1 Tax=Lagenidium giganteum TaxID=4803 RepID=A0AAV2ZAM4_9STRA|nr:TPA: hypothetical protein N0F65_006173 [Lagenidium giganteum]
MIDTIDVHDHLCQGSCTGKNVCLAQFWGFCRSAHISIDPQRLRNQSSDTKASSKRQQSIGGPRAYAKTMPFVATVSRQRGAQQARQRPCKVCKKRASFYCDDCSTPSKNVLYTLCVTGTQRECYKPHLEAGAYARYM